MLFTIKIKIIKYQIQNILKKIESVVEPPLKGEESSLVQMDWRGSSPCTIRDIIVQKIIFGQ